MDQEHEEVKQQADRQQEILKTRRRIEENRANFFAQRRYELEQAQQAREQATKNKQEKQEALKRQVLLAKRFVGERAA